MWKNISAFANDHWRLVLRIAGNVTVFAFFPVGWAWMECDWPRDHQIASIFGDAEKLGRLADPRSHRPAVAV